MKTLKRRNILFTLGTLFLAGLAYTIFSSRGQAHASWSWGTWLDQSFRDSNPSDGNIIYALYGNGQPGDTVYTKNWTDSCIPSTVVHTTTIPTTINANTIYVLGSGNYTLTSLPVSMTGCSALIGNGRITLNKT